jgi:hypothetical protein
MFALRILRNISVLAILTAAVLTSTPRSATAQSSCLFLPKCIGPTTACHYCSGGSTRCCTFTCYDWTYRRLCNTRPY